MRDAESFGELRASAASGKELFQWRHTTDDSRAIKFPQVTLPPFVAAKAENLRMRQRETMGERLRQARKLRQLSQDKAAEFLGLTHGALGQWERAETIPTLENLISIAAHYNASLDWLVWGGAMGSGIEARIRKIPDVLRVELIERLNKEIDQTEEAAKRLPKEMLGIGATWQSPRVQPSEPVRSAKQKAKSKAKSTSGAQ